MIVSPPEEPADIGSSYHQCYFFAREQLLKELAPVPDQYTSDLRRRESRDRPVSAHGFDKWHSFAPRASPMKGGLILPGTDLDQGWTLFAARLSAQTQDKR
jgi:hypothetical protein